MTGRIVSLISFLTLLALGAFFTFPPNASAQGLMTSPNYHIQMPNFNSGAGIPSSDSYFLRSTIGQTAAGEFSSTSFRVKSGFAYVQTIIPFSFTISDYLIDFETLSKQVPVTKTATLTVKAGGAGGYSVKALENHPLEASAGVYIDDTLCDSGPCSESSAESWTLNTTYGFGFNMAGDDVPGDFSGDKYRQFADAAIPESPKIFMSKTDVTWDNPNNAWPWESIAQITYKVNIGPLQKAGHYENMVTFIAVPSF